MPLPVTFSVPPLVATRPAIPVGAAVSMSSVPDRVTLDPLLLSSAMPPMVVKIEPESSTLPPVRLRIEIAGSVPVVAVIEPA